MAELWVQDALLPAAEPAGGHWEELGGDVLRQLPVEAWDRVVDVVLPEPGELARRLGEVSAC